MEFRTQVVIPKPDVSLSYHTKCLFMGSCFSDNIGKLMVNRKFPVMLNPFGTLFNPQSIADNLRILMAGSAYRQSDLHYHNGLWMSFNHYTGFSHPDAGTCLSGINHSAMLASSWLRQCDYLVLTFGTAWAYKFNQTGITVANCHKLPASEFTRYFLEPDDIAAQYDALIPEITKINPNIRFLFTLSPVRHWSDGAVHNQLSKSCLHLSIHKILEKHPHTFYFPAYEIFMDELRDYRYYAADMLHPSEQGTQYVWERFCDTWIDEPSKKIMAGVSAILRALGHRPLHTATTNHKKFRLNTIKKIEQLKTSYPFLDFSHELEELR